MPVGGSGVSNFAYSAGVAAGVSAVNRMGSAGVRADFSGNPILALFASGEEGAWYDPSDLSTMFTTSTGTTAAAVDGPVGLVLDKRFGLERGDENVNNGMFDEDLSGWTLGADPSSWSWDSEGRAFCDNATEFGDSFSQSCLPAGSWAEIEVDITVISGALDVGASAGQSINLSNVSASGVYRRFYFNDNVTTERGIIFRRNFGAGEFTGYLNSVSVRPLPGNHATQANDALRGLLISDGDGLAIRHNAVDDNIPATIPAITNGVLIVSGRTGTWVQQGYNATGSHTLNLGAVSSYPGWADVVGADEVQVVLRDGTLTTAQIDAVVARMQALGGGPRVVAFAPTGSLFNWFRGLGLHVLDVGDWNTAAVTSFQNFAQTNNLTTLDVSDWNTAAVTSFQNFAQTNNLTTLDVSDWNTANVATFASFAYTNNLTTLDVSGWNTVKVATFASFARDNNLTTLDVSGWNTANVTSFASFARDNALTTLDVSGWSTNCLTWTNFCTNNALTAAALDGILVMIAAQGTSNGTFSTSGASMNAPTATGEAAIDTLRGRGWTITVPGGY